MTDIPPCPVCRTDDNVRRDMAHVQCVTCGLQAPIGTWRALPMVVEDAEERLDKLIRHVDMRFGAVGDVRAAVLSCMVVPPKGAGERTDAGDLASVYGGPPPPRYFQMRPIQFKCVTCNRGSIDHPVAMTIDGQCKICFLAGVPLPTTAAPPVPPAPTTDEQESRAINVAFDVISKQEGGVGFTLLAAFHAGWHASKRAATPAPVEPPADAAPDADALIDWLVSARMDLHHELSRGDAKKAAAADEVFKEAYEKLKARIQPAPATVLTPEHAARIIIGLESHMPHNARGWLNNRHIAEVFGATETLAKSPASVVPPVPPPESQDTERLIDEFEDAVDAFWHDKTHSTDVELARNALRNALRSALSRRPVTAEALWKTLLDLGVCPNVGASMTTIGGEKTTEMAIKHCSFASLAAALRELEKR